MIIEVLAVIPYFSEKNDGSRGYRPPEFNFSSFSSFAYPKGTSLCQDASFEPSTINIGSGVRPVDVRKKKIGKGRIPKKMR